jgi:hypothetical protein
MAEFKSILDSTRHGPLIADMQRICEVANVPRHHVEVSMKNYCRDDQVEWVSTYLERKKKGEGGLVLSGWTDSEIRCYAIAGAFLRSYIDARVYSFNEVIDSPDKSSSATVLLIPNFFNTNYGKQLASWQLGVLHDVLVRRLSASKMTVLGVSSVEEMISTYGAYFGEFFKNHYFASKK